MRSFFLFFLLSALALTACSERDASINSGKSRAFCLSSFSLLSDLAETADIFRTECNDFNIEFDNPKLTSVTNQYGPSVFKERALPYKSAMATASVKPWSSWWFPKKENTLFASGDASTLGKFDEFRRWAYNEKNITYPGDSLEYEKKSYNPNSLTWEGLCDAWSLAAISVAEPKKQVTIKTGWNSSIDFNSSDLKALLLKTYEAVPDQQVKIHGERFTGDNDGWIFPDIFPDQFHRFIEIKLFEQKQAFVMDHDPGPQVWNVPVFKANYLVEAVADNPDAVFIRMWVYSAEPALATNRDIMGTRESMREYQYVLQGKRNENGDLVINSGYWIKGATGIDSRKDHPDYLLDIRDPKLLTRKSWNPYIEVELVDWILRQ